MNKTKIPALIELCVEMVVTGLPYGPLPIQGGGLLPTSRGCSRCAVCPLLTPAGSLDHYSPGGTILPTNY